MRCLNSKRLFKGPDQRFVFSFLLLFFSLPLPFSFSITGFTEGFSASFLLHSRWVRAMGDVRSAIAEGGRAVLGLVLMLD